MTRLTDFHYSPAIRTRRAELKGLSAVNGLASRKILPLFELTRSRRTKSNPEGSVEISVEELLAIMGSAPFAVDVTSLGSLTNRQVEQLLDPDQNFSNWTKFVSEFLPKVTIPVVHLTDPYDDQSVSAQINTFRARHDAVAVRIPTDFQDVDLLVATVERVLGGFQNVVVYVDVGLVTQRGYKGAVARAVDVILAVSELNPGLVVPLASSFPSTVTPYGDVNGSFKLFEVALSEYLSEEFPELNCMHGDYACIHPIDFEGMAVNWVPRVDVPLDDSLFYHRYRRNDGGYVRAAAMVLADDRYAALPCWADESIRQAASGNPEGKSPAFWISARLNFHIERQLERLGL